MIPTNADVSISVVGRLPANAQAAIVFVPEDEPEASESGQVLGKDVAESVRRLMTAGVAKGKANEVRFDLLGSGKRATRVFVAGLGKSQKISDETIRQSAGAVARALRKHGIARAVVALPVVKNIPAARAAEAVTGGMLLAAFDYREYKGSASKSKDEPPAKPLAVQIVAAARERGQVAAAVSRTVIVCRAQNFARTIASRPGNDINPPSLAAVARQMAREVGLRCTIMDERQLRKLGMGGILAVGGGSIFSPPRLIVLEHRPGAGRRGANSTLLVVGKAITFDAGGISIKPAEKMGKMIFDKCGGMTVLGLMYAVAALRLPIHVVGILAAAENVISSRAYRPGDILRMFNGATVEVTNTDAEGRLVLADALAWGIGAYKPAAVVDLATLTGGVIVALGRNIAGIMSNDDHLVAELTRAADVSGEKLWRLPLGDEQREFIKSDCADIVNSAGREGHPLQGGAFLSYFVPENGSTPWAHLDIAGVADTEKELPYYAKGATGWGVRTLVQWVSGRCKFKEKR
jgi:leucyl aminopeptidase